jgi:osmoprotectant transport system substrate-binding protein
MRQKMKISAVIMGMFLITLFFSANAIAADKKLVVGAKNFTEQRILGYIMIELLEKHGFSCRDRTGLGGTLVARNALENRQIDIYMEYTGTGLITILKHKTPITDPQECYNTVKAEDLEKNGLVWLPYMSFNNTYCLLMRREESENLSIKTCRIYRTMSRPTLMPSISAPMKNFMPVRMVTNLCRKLTDLSFLIGKSEKWPLVCSIRD